MQFDIESDHLAELVKAMWTQLRRCTEYGWR
jgi:hypothetical protein